MKRLIVLKDYYEQPNLPLGVEYQVAVRKVSYNAFNDTIQLAIEIENEDIGKRGYVFEEFKIGSDDFSELIRHVYPLEFYCIIELDTQDFEWFFGSAFLKKEDEMIKVNWDTFKPDSTPFSAMREFYREHDSEKYW